jgi:nicotinate-nucleotide adenylyltransferase
MGADNLAQFHRWRGWAQIFAKVPIAVIGRPGQSVGGRMAIAARRFASARLPASRARLLASLPPPAWTYLRGRWNFASSTALRSRLRAAAE